MRSLVVEDAFTCRKFLQRILANYGDCDVAVSGGEAIVAFRSALEAKTPYDLVCLDIMMPGMDGQKTLEALRAIEKKMNISEVDGVKVIMTTSLNDPHNVMKAHYNLCHAYLIKPVEKDKLLEELKKLQLIS